MVNEMEKTIHYCWFGGSPLPALAEKCIASWGKNLPGYRICRWDETNFDVTVCAYTAEAYENRKWAYVSDYARFWIIYNYGGIYFDTDVEVIRPMDDILSNGSFMGCERTLHKDGSFSYEVAPGLGIAAGAGMPVFRQILDMYENMHFKKPDGSFNLDTVVQNVAEVLKSQGFRGTGSHEMVAGLHIYPPEFFCPLDFYTGEKKITVNTRTIHHYAQSWMSPTCVRIHDIRRYYASLGKTGCFQEKLVLFPLRVKNRVENEGLRGLLRTK